MEWYISSPDRINCQSWLLYAAKLFRIKAEIITFQDKQKTNSSWSPDQPYRRCLRESCTQKWKNDIYHHDNMWKYKVYYTQIRKKIRHYQYNKQSDPKMNKRGRIKEYSKQLEENQHNYKHKSIPFLISLKVDGINSPTKRRRLAEWIKK